MNEQKIIKKQLAKNMLYTFIVFAIILLLFDVMIYNQVSNSLYKTIDEELLKTAKSYMEISSKRNLNTFSDKFLEIKVNPRLICIVRNLDGDIINKDKIGRLYDDYLYGIKFEKTKVNSIYSVKIQNEYNYRGINVKYTSQDGEETYIQFLANVDGEVQTIDNLTSTLLVWSLIIIGVAIIGSYLLSKMTLRPILDSYRKQTEFVQNASHELRTPLTIIQAKEELLLQEPNSKIIDKSEDINIVLKETKRLTKLIKELMILAMADANELKLNKEKVNIDNLISEVLIPYKEYGEIQGKQIELNLNYNKEINVDINKINQLMVILLDNAIKYTFEGDKIEVKTNYKDGRCIIEVIDTGIGISKEAAKHIFDRFYREDQARTRQKGGTGLRTINSTYNNKIT